jgi:hypothetical protein
MVEMTEWNMSAPQEKEKINADPLRFHRLI